MPSVQARQPESAKELADKIFLELHQQITAQEPEAKSGNVEAIHDMRVAIRRFRVALSNFSACILPTDRQQVRLRLEHLANALGGVRDLDVMIESLKLSLPTRSEKDRQALSQFIKRLQLRRRARLRRLKSYFEGREYAEFKAGNPNDQGLMMEKEPSLGQSL